MNEAIDYRVFLVGWAIVTVLSIINILMGNWDSTLHDLLTGSIWTFIGVWSISQLVWWGR